MESNSKIYLILPFRIMKLKEFFSKLPKIDIVLFFVEKNSLNYCQMTEKTDKNSEQIIFLFYFGSVVLFMIFIFIALFYFLQKINILIPYFILFFFKWAQQVV